MSHQMSQPFTDYQLIKNKCPNVAPFLKKKYFFTLQFFNLSTGTWDTGTLSHLIRCKIHTNPETSQ